MRLESQAPCAARPAARATREFQSPRTRPGRPVGPARQTGGASPRVDWRQRTACAARSPRPRAVPQQARTKVASRDPASASLPLAAGPPLATCTKHLPLGRPSRTSWGISFGTGIRTAAAFRTMAGDALDCGATAIYSYSSIAFRQAGGAAARPPRGRSNPVTQCPATLGNCAGGGRRRWIDRRSVGLVERLA